MSEESALRNQVEAISEQLNEILEMFGDHGEGLSVSGKLKFIKKNVALLLRAQQSMKADGLPVIVTLPASHADSSSD